MKDIKVGTASVNWGFDPLYTWVQTPTFDRLLDEMTASGYEGTEISYHFPTDSVQLRRDLRQRNLAAAATFHEVQLLDPSRHADEVSRAVPVAERLQALGSDTLILSDHTSPYRLRVAGHVAADGGDGLTHDLWDSLVSGLHLIGEMLKERGMTAVFHPHVGTYIETRDEIDELMRRTDPALIALCPDTGHLAYAGADVKAVFRDYSSRIRYIHLKDVDRDKLDRVRSEKLDFVEATRLGAFVPLGEGFVDIPGIFSYLDQANYRGWIIVEQDAPLSPLASAVQNREYLRSTIGI